MKDYVMDVMAWLNQPAGYQVQCNRGLIIITNVKDDAPSQQAAICCAVQLQALAIHDASASAFQLTRNHSRGRLRDPE